MKGVDIKKIVKKTRINEENTKKSYVASELDALKGTNDLRIKIIGHDDNDSRIETKWMNVDEDLVSELIKFLETQV